MSRRASLPGAEELFRSTRSESPQKHQPAEERPVAKSTSLQVATEAPPKKGPKHQEKITFYCTPEDLIGLEKARLTLRGDHGIAADRGRIVRAALHYVLEDFEARAADSILLRELGD